MKNAIFIDYENVQPRKISSNLEEYDLYIMVGSNQNKIPLELVKYTQSYGSQVQWVQVEGAGKNALDFFIAYYLGKFVAQKAYGAYYIVSKDNGYEPLVNHIQKSGIQIERVVSMEDVFNKKRATTSKTVLDRVTENLRKLNAANRPKKEKGLKASIKAMVPKYSDEEIGLIVEDLLRNEAIQIVDGHIRYRLTEPH